MGCEPTALRLTQGPLLLGSNRDTRIGQTPLSFPYMPIGWRLATFEVGKGRGESSPSFVGGFGGRGLLLAVLDSSTRSFLWLGWPACGADGWPDFPVGLH